MIGTDELKQAYGINIAAIILVCRVFAGTATQEDIKAWLSGNDPDWDTLYKLISYHQLRPVAFSILHKLDIPEKIKARLQADCRIISLHNIEQTKELVRIYELLEKAGVYVLPYKGSIFCLAYYKDIGLREFSDIDFLLRLNFDDLAKLKRVFDGQGYIDKSDVPDDFKKIHFNHTREYAFDFYEKEKRKFHAEFHWYTAHPVLDFTTPMPVNELFSEPDEQVVFGKNIKTPNDTSHFIAMVSHHGLNQEWMLLKYIMDLVQILKNGKTLDWPSIQKKSFDHGFNNSLNIGLHIADALLGISPGIIYPRPVNGEKYLNNLLTTYASRKKIGILASLVSNINNKHDTAGKIKMVVKYMDFATMPSILDYRFLKLPKSLFFLYPLVKPFRLLSGLPSWVRNDGRNHKNRFTI